MKKVLLLSALLIFNHLTAQDYGNKTDAIRLCEAMQGEGYISDESAELALDKILSVIGVSKSFVMMPCDNINNAVAVSLLGIRYILYDRDFIRSLNNKNDWNGLFIFAHEVGHHVNGHSLDVVLYASETIKLKSLAQKREQELEADEFAGFILGKLGATLEQTSQSIYLLSSNEDDEHSTHPSKYKRLSSVKKGYEKAIGDSKFTKDYKSKRLITDEYFYSAYEKANKKNHIGAIEDYSKVIKINPNLAEAYYNRGLSKVNLKDHGGAIEDYSKAISINPNYFKAYNSRGVSKAELKDHTGAIHDFSKAIDLNSDFYVAYNSRGVSNANLKKDNAAIEDYSKAIKINPNYAFAYYNRSISKANLLDFKAAIEDSSKAIEINLNYDKAYTSRGIYKILIKKYTEAIEDFTKAININPNNSSAYYNRGISKANLQDFKGACEDARKSQKLGYNSEKFINDVCY